MLLSCLELSLNQGQPTALGPGANTDTKLLIYGLFQKGRVLAQDGVYTNSRRSLESRPYGSQEHHRQYSARTWHRACAGER